MIKFIKIGEKVEFHPSKLIHWTVEIFRIETWIPIPIQ